jgi:type I restriction enzyme R subunit
VQAGFSKATPTDGVKSQEDTETAIRQFLAEVQGLPHKNLGLELLTKLLKDDIQSRSKEMREAHKRGEALDLSEEEVAFSDALEVNDSPSRSWGTRRCAPSLASWSRRSGGTPPSTGR